MAKDENAARVDLSSSLLARDHRNRVSGAAGREIEVGECTAKAKAARGQPARRKGKAARRAPEPGYDGRRELVSDDVHDPDNDGRQKAVVRNARHDPIEHLYHKGLIGNAEREAGRRVREMVEALGLDAVRAIVLDGTVGGSLRAEFPQRRIDAGRAMLALRRDVGSDYAAVLVRIAGYGETVTAVAVDLEEDERGHRNGACSDFARKFAGRFFRQALEAAARHFGYLGARERRGLIWRIEGWELPVVDVDA